MESRDIKYLITNKIARSYKLKMKEVHTPKLDVNYSNQLH